MVQIHDAALLLMCKTVIQVIESPWVSSELLINSELHLLNEVIQYQSQVSEDVQCLVWDLAKSFQRDLDAALERKGNLTTLVNHASQ